MPDLHASVASPLCTGMDPCQPCALQLQLQPQGLGQTLVQMSGCVCEQQQVGMDVLLLLLMHAPNNQIWLAGSQNTEIACLTCTPARPPLCAQVCAEGPRLLDYELRISHAHVVKLIVGTSAALLHIPVHSCAEVVPHSSVAFLLLRLLLLLLPPLLPGIVPHALACLLQGTEEHDVLAGDYETARPCSCLHIHLYKKAYPRTITLRIGARCVMYWA